MGSLSVRLILGDNLRNSQQVDVACTLAARSIGIILKDQDILDSFADISRDNENLCQHSMNVCLFSMVLGRQLGLSRTRLQLLGIGALLHDVGMSKVPNQILMKPGKLTDDEFALIKNHPTWGHQILSLSPQVPYDALNIVLCHHERSDGKGYPAGLKGRDIPFLSKIVSLVDRYDAMTSPRPYREPNQPFQTAQYLLGEAKDDQEKEIVREFFKIHKHSFVGDYS